MTDHHSGSRAAIAPFRAAYAPADEDLAAEFLKAAPFSADAEARIDGRAGRLVAAIRGKTGGVGGIEDFLREYSLSTREGLALMVLAEALLRVPDAATADRLMSFAKEFAAQLPETKRHEIMQALREILVNAMEHGAAFNPDQVVEVNAIRTARTMTFRVRDPGAGFRKDSITHAAFSSPDPTAHILQRDKQGIRAGGYGLLLAAGTVDELIYNELGNEVILIKYLDTPTASINSP